MRIRLFILFAAALLVLNLQPAVSLAAVNTPDSAHMSGQNMDMPVSAGHNHNMDMTGHNMSDTVYTETPNMSGHTMDMPADTESASDLSGHNMPGHTVDMPGDEPGHGSHVSNSSGAGSESTEVNRAGLLGGFGLLNGFIILSSIVMRKKMSPFEGGSSNER